MLIIEVEGSVAEQDRLLDRIKEICARFDPISLKVSQSAEELAAIWKGRKSAFGAVGRISPDYLCMDGTIPTSRLPEVLRRIGEMSAACGLQVANIFHAGDGNLHPLIMFDANDPVSFAKAEKFGADISEALRRGRRLPDRRARRRRGEARPDAGTVLRDRIGAAAPDQERVRSGCGCSTPTRFFPWSRRRRSHRPHDGGGRAHGRGGADFCRCGGVRKQHAAGSARQRQQARPAAAGAGGAQPFHHGADRHFAVFAAGTGAVRACRHTAGDDRGGGRRARPADHRPSRRISQHFWAKRACRRWAAWLAPTCPARAASPGARRATTCSACAR